MQQTSLTFEALYLIDYLFQVFKCHIMTTIMLSDFLSSVHFLLNFCFQAEIRTDFNILYSMMKKHEEFRWMRLRIRRMADAWIQAIKSLAEKQNLEKRKRKKVSF